ncbi:MAG: transporter, partial [Flavobacterium sp.]
MKRYFFLFFTGLSLTILNAQETTPEDALRLAVENLTGTARYRAMGGAFGALGGDLSAININPAGSIYFNNNFGSITASVYNVKNNSNYFGTGTSNTDSKFDLNQIGSAFVFVNKNPQDDWTKFSFALNYDNGNTFNNSIYSAGTNPKNSIGNYFLNFAQGIPLNYLTDYNYYELNFNEQQAFLGYDTYIIDSQTGIPTDTRYYSNVPAGGNYFQQNFVYTSGHNGKMVTNFSTSYRDIVSLGINLNFSFVSILKTTSVFETNNNPLNESGSTISEILFENQLYTSGNGFSFNAGTIIKPIDNLRIGFAYESPTWYDLIDELTQGVRTRSLNNPDNIQTPTSYQFPIVYLPYSIETPGKFTYSLAYIFNQNGLLSFDFSTKNYANTKFKPENDPIYRDLNQYMNSRMQNAFT